jgi:hypothetical protein
VEYGKTSSVSRLNTSWAATGLRMFCMSNATFCRISAGGGFQNPSSLQQEQWIEGKWNEVKWSEMKWSEVKGNEVKWSEVKWNEMKWSEVKRREEIECEN